MGFFGGNGGRIDFMRTVKVVVESLMRQARARVAMEKEAV